MEDFARSNRCLSPAKCNRSSILRTAIKKNEFCDRGLLGASQIRGATCGATRALLAGRTEASAPTQASLADQSSRQAREGGVAFREIYAHGGAGDTGEGCG